MSLKKRQKATPDFNMASMTDMIFLLLIFFMITSTVVSPNAIKVLLPQSNQQTVAKNTNRVIIDSQLQYYTAFGKQRETMVPNIEGLIPFFQECYQNDPEVYIALYADESLPYSEVVKVIDLANQHQLRLILVTRPK